MKTTPKIEYRVRKVEIHRKQCAICGGTGKREQKIGGIFKTINCQHCHNGVANIEHITEVDLKTAMNEMGIYNTIRNTVAEIIKNNPTPLACQQNQNV